MGQDTPGQGGEAALPPSLRFLKWLVIALTLTMIGGVITVVALLVTRMPQAFTPAPAQIANPAVLGALPPAIVLPAGTEARAVTFGTGWIGVVVAEPQTDRSRILIYAPEGNIIQDIPILAP